MTLYAVSTVKSNNDTKVNTDSIYNYYMQHPKAKNSFVIEECDTVFYALDNDDEGTKDYKNCTCKLILREAILQYKDVTYARPSMPKLINFTKADIVDKNNNIQFTIDSMQAATIINVTGQNDTATLFTSEFRQFDTKSQTTGGFGGSGPTTTTLPFDKIPFFTREGAKPYTVNGTSYTFVKNSANFPVVSTCPEAYKKNDGIQLAKQRALNLRHKTATMPALQFCNFTTSIENNPSDVEVASAELNIHMSLTTNPDDIVTVITSATSPLLGTDDWWFYGIFDSSSDLNKGNIFALQAWHDNIPHTATYKYTRQFR